jgi:hypothetical protein
MEETKDKDIERSLNGIADLKRFQHFLERLCAPCC